MSCMNSLLQQTFLCSWFRMIIYLTTASDDIAVSFRPLREEVLFLNHRGFPKPNHCQTRVNLTEKPSNLFGIHFSLFFLPGYTHLHLQCIYGTSSIIELPPAAFGSSAEAAFGSSALTAEKAPAPLCYPAARMPWEILRQSHQRALTWQHRGWQPDTFTQAGLAQTHVCSQGRGGRMPVFRQSLNMWGPVFHALINWNWPPRAKPPRWNSPVFDPRLEAWLLWTSIGASKLMPWRSWNSGPQFPVCKTGRPAGVVWGGMCSLGWYPERWQCCIICRHPHQGSSCASACQGSFIIRHTAQGPSILQPFMWVN